MSTAIEFNHVSKQYRLGLVSTRTLSHDLQRWWTMNIRGKEDPYLKIGETNDRSTKGSSDYVWALKDIDFKVEQGDVVGIIGKNGAGKSTLLKLLSKVTGPTTGSIKARGRIGALLEVGTGFHSEMTGRENIFLNGAILGMSRQEISRKLDEIVDFSGCERYIDTPVKRYLSGMMVRLGFAVAAHLDPEILVVDEVLAVGDAEFQKKAIGKMQDVSKGEGRTVLFANHKTWAKPEIGRGGFELLEIGIRRKGADYSDVMRMDQELEIVIRYRLTTELEKFWITMHLKNETGNKMFSFSGGGRCYEKHHISGEYEQVCHIPANFLNWGNYSIDFLAISQPSNIICLADEPDIISFTISNRQVEIGGYMGKEPGDITPRFEFEERKI